MSSNLIRPIRLFQKSRQKRLSEKISSSSDLLLYIILLAFATLLKVSILYVHESILSPFQKSAGGKNRSGVIMTKIEVWSQDGEHKETREKVKRYPLFPTLRAKHVLELYGYEIKRDYERIHSGSHAPFPWAWAVYDKRDGSSIAGILRKTTLFGKPTYSDANTPSAVRTELRDFCNIKTS